jgi:hypothetical protein
VQDTVAFVTLRSGGTCGSNADQLLSVSIADPANPYTLQTKNVLSPYGLAVKDSLLYVSNGYRGFTLYSVHDPYNLTSLSSWSGTNTKDFIWTDSTLYVMGFNDITIMSVSDPQNPVVLGRIQ